MSRLRCCFIGDKSFVLSFDRVAAILRAGVDRRRARIVFSCLLGLPIQAMDLMLRRQAGGGLATLMLLDVASILLGQFWLAGVTSRLVSWAVMIFAECAGLAATGTVKRASLCEPLIFAGRASCSTSFGIPSSIAICGSVADCGRCAGRDYRYCRDDLVRTAGIRLPRRAVSAGDHQPSLPETFAALGFTDELPDYEVWSAECEKGFLQDLEIKDLSDLLLALQAATQ